MFLFYFLAEKFQQLQVSNQSQEILDPTFCRKRKPMAAKRHCQPEVEVNCRSEEEDDEEGDDDNQDGEEGEYEDKTCPMTPPQHPSRCSRGVSTHESDELTHKNATASELTLDDSSPPSTTSSTISDKAKDNHDNGSKRFEDGKFWNFMFGFRSTPQSHKQQNQEKNTTHGWNLNTLFNDSFYFNLLWWLNSQQGIRFPSSHR